MERLWMTLDQIKSEYASNDYNPELLLQHLLHHVEASPASAPEGLTLDAIHAAWHGAGVDIAGGNWKRFVVMLSDSPTPPVSEERKDAERYRWLRDIGNNTWKSMIKRGITATQCDSAIDAEIVAMQEDKP